MRSLLPALGIAAAVGIVSCLGTRALIPLLARRGVLDRPNERSSHRVATPRGGGIAAVGAMLLGWAALALTGEAPPVIAAVIAGALLLAAVSWIDDLTSLSPAVRLPVHCAAAALGLLALPHPVGLLAVIPAPLLYPLILVLWVYAANIFNFMDGIDGLAGGEAAAVGAGLILLFALGADADAPTALLAAALLGAALGFLVWNWPPARIFLGDVGSVPLGYLIGFLLIGMALSGYWRAALILPLYFLADASLTLIRRLLLGEPIWQAHRRHFYQRAVASGLSHRAVTARILAADLLLIVLAWGAETGWGTSALVAAGALVLVLLARFDQGR